MSLRAAFSCSVVLASPSALATSSVRLVPFSNHCFDQERLASRLRLRGVTLEIGPTSTRAGQQVEVRGTEALDVRIEAHDDAGRVVGLESRRVPDGPCESVLETVELVIVRAATPLHFIPEAPPHSRPHAPRTAEVPVPAKAQPAALPLVETSETTRPDPPAPAVVVAPVVAAPVIVTPITVVRVVAAPPPLRPPLRFELALHGLWLIPLDDPPSAVAGDVELAVRWSRRLGIGLHAGVANVWHSADRSEHSGAAIEVRRVPLALLLEVGLRLPYGEVRLSAGPLVQLWRVESSGVSQPRTILTAQPGLEARALYRYGLRRWFVEFGLQLDVGVLRHDFIVTGSGTLTHTPVADVAPIVGGGVSF